jgi:hypothetical protein
MASLLKEKTHYVSLAISLVIALPTSIGILTLYYILAWLNFGEGNNSQLYNTSTVVLIITSALVTISFVLFRVAKYFINKERKEKAKSILITGMVILLLFSIIIVSQY